MNFGRSIRHYWLLEEDWIFLNHGSFGATPSAVLDAQMQWRRGMERQPVRFMTQELPQKLRAAATELAAFVGAKGEDLVFVENATAGANAVVRSLSLTSGDTIVTTDHVYGAVRKALSFVCKQTGASLVEAKVPFPIAHEDEVVAAIAAVLNPNVKLLVVDCVTSPTALVLPVASLIRLAKTHGVPVLVDGAHAPGMLPLDLEALGADWYVGNCHKWLFAPKGCGFLWAKPERQIDLHPTVISHGFGEGFLAEFDWTGTRDPSAWLAVTAAIAFYRQFGATAIRAYNHNLAVWAGQTLAEAWNRQLPAPISMLGAMAVVQVPNRGITRDASKLHEYLQNEHRIEVPIVPFANKLWVRVSAQVYNEPEDYRHLAKAL